MKNPWISPEKKTIYPLSITQYAQSQTTHADARTHPYERGRQRQCPPHPAVSLISCSALPISRSPSPSIQIQAATSPPPIDTEGPRGERLRGKPATSAAPPLTAGGEWWVSQRSCDLTIGILLDLYHYLLVCLVSCSIVSCWICIMYDTIL